MVMPDAAYLKNGIICYKYDEVDFKYCNNIAHTMGHTAYLNNVDIITPTTQQTTSPTTEPTAEPTAAPTRDKTAICITGSFQSLINGRYEYFSWNSDFNGPIYYNSQTKMYLYPWIYSSGSKRYHISDNSSNTTGDSYCFIPSSSDPMTPLDCYNINGPHLITFNSNQGVFWNDNGALLTLCETISPTTPSKAPSKIPTTAPSKTPSESPTEPSKAPSEASTVQPTALVPYTSLTYNSLCFIGSTNSTYDGTYEFLGTSDNPSGLIWKHSERESYLYPWHDGDSVQWKIGGSQQMSNATLLCTASATNNGYYAILDQGCYKWQENVGSSGWIENDKISILPGQCGSVTALQRYQWQCSAFTNYQAPKKISDTFSVFRTYLGVLVAFASVYAFFCIVHDCTLVHHKQNLKDVAFLPTSYDEFYITHSLYKVLMAINREISNQSSCIVIVFLGIGWFLIFVILMAFILIELIAVPIIYPIFEYVCCRRKCSCNDHISLCKYISASSVGLAIWCMCISTIALLYKIVDGFSFEIQPLDPDRCKCECKYVFQKRDYWEFLGVTSIFIGLSGIFLWSWTNEAIHGHHFLYLIKYRLPIKYANIINPQECTGSMLQEVELISAQTETTDLQTMTEQKQIDVGRSRPFDIATEDMKSDDVTEEEFKVEMREMDVPTSVNNTPHTTKTNESEMDIKEEDVTEERKKINKNTTNTNQSWMDGLVTAVSNDVKNKKFGLVYRMFLFLLMITSSLFFGCSALSETLYVNPYGYASWVEKSNVVVLLILSIAVELIIIVVMYKYILIKNKIQGKKLYLWILIYLVFYCVGIFECLSNFLYDDSTETLYFLLGFFVLFCLCSFVVSVWCPLVFFP